MTPTQKKRALSGIKPTGKPHIGNYFGMIKQLINLQDEYEVFAFIPDYHALNSVQDPKLLREYTFEVVADYIALGLDPKKVVLYKQSDVTGHTELAWIFDTITSMPYLERAHAYKDAEAAGREINVGVFNYPMLMAADILLYDPDVVPVGQDQKQHIEITRDTAQKFNRLFGDTFKLPKEMIIEGVAIVPGIDGRKMSKSYDNTIGIFDSEEETLKKVMSIVTDSKSDVPENVYNIHKLFRDEKELKTLYKEKKGNYKELKELLATDINTFFKSAREKRKDIDTRKDLVEKVLEEGAKTARGIAERKMELVKNHIGVK